MNPSRSLHLAAWVAYAVVGILHLGSLVSDLGALQRATQPLFAPLLLVALLSAAPRLSRSTRFVVLGLLSAWAGDTLGQLAPAAVQQLAVIFFLITLICYSIAMAPLWRRSRDGLRMALAIPYGAVVVGLFLACADGAGSSLPLFAAYAVALATMAFLSAGGNAFTWTGGTLFLVSSSVLAMEWFLPGAAIAYSTVWVMVTYIVGQALIIGGIVLLLPERRWTAHAPGAALVIVES